MKKIVFLVVAVFIFSSSFAQTVNYRYHLQKLGNLQSFSYTFEKGNHAFSPGISLYTKGQLRFDNLTSVTSV